MKANYFAGFQYNLQCLRSVTKQRRISERAHDLKESKWLENSQQHFAKIMQPNTERERKKISCRFLFIDILYMVRKNCTFIVMCKSLYIFILQIHSFFGKCKFKPLKNLYIWQIYIYYKKNLLYIQVELFIFQTNDIYSYTIYIKSAIFMYFPMFQ